MKRGLQLSTKEARQLVEILGEYQTELESVIESHTLEDGSTPPIDPDAKPVVAECRRKWKRAEDWVKRLSGGSSAVRNEQASRARLAGQVARRRHNLSKGR